MCDYFYPSFWSYIQKLSQFSVVLLMFLFIHEISHLLSSAVLPSTERWVISRTQSCFLRCRNGRSVGLPSFSEHCLQVHKLMEAPIQTAHSISSISWLAPCLRYFFMFISYKFYIFMQSNPSSYKSQFYFQYY